MTSPSSASNAICGNNEGDVLLVTPIRPSNSSRRLFAWQSFCSLDALLRVSMFPLLLCSLAHAQAPYPYDPVQDISNSPLRLHEGSDIDSIDLDTGDLTVKIPLISYPQRGGILRADFTLTGSVPGVVYTQFSIPGGGGRMIWQACAPLGGCGGFSATGSVGVIYSGFPGLATTVSKGGTGESFDQSWVVDADGSLHLVGWLNSTTQGRTLDGSGFSVNALTPPYTVTDSHGVKTTWPSGSGPVTTTDPNGNTLSLVSDSGNGFIPTITDTVGRTLPIGGTNNIWTLPGVNGGSETFTFSQPTSTQSVVTLKDNSSYTFQYTVVPFALLAGQTVAQKTALLSQVTLPTGGTIAWSYSPTPIVSPCRAATITSP